MAATMFSAPRPGRGWAIVMVAMLPGFGCYDGASGEGQGDTDGGSMLSASGSASTVGDAGGTPGDAADDSDRSDSDGGGSDADPTDNGDPTDDGPTTGPSVEVPGFVKLEVLDASSIEVDLGASSSVLLRATPLDGFDGLADLTWDADLGVDVSFTTEDGIPVTALDFSGGRQSIIAVEVSSDVVDNGGVLTVPPPQSGSLQLALQREDVEARVSLDAQAGPAFVYVLNEVDETESRIFPHDEVIVEVGVVMFIVNPSSMSHGLHGNGVFQHMDFSQLDGFKDGMAWNPVLDQQFTPGASRSAAMDQGAFDGSGQGSSYCHQHQGSGQHAGERLEVTVVQ